VEKPNLFGFFPNAAYLHGALRRKNSEKSKGKLSFVEMLHYFMVLATYII